MTERETSLEKSSEKAADRDATKAAPVGPIYTDRQTVTLTKLADGGRDTALMTVGDY